MKKKGLLESLPIDAAARVAVFLGLAVVALYLFPLHQTWPFSILEMQYEEGFAYWINLGETAGPGDGEEARTRSGLELFEDARSLGPAHSYHDAIRCLGRGRYCQWGGELYFSTSDNSDPRLNGRTYYAVFPVRPSPRLVIFALCILALASARLVYSWRRAR